MIQSGHIFSIKQQQIES